MAKCIVIHGTWGSRSDFGFADSLFCRALKASLKYDTDFYRFEWSGANSAKERSHSSLRLRRLIKELSDKNNSVFLIAHSHGGNVAVEALQDDETASHVGGLITLGTPFLSIEIRKWVNFLPTLPGRMCLYLLFMGIVLFSTLSIIGSLIGIFHFSLGLLGGCIICSIIYQWLKGSEDDLLKEIIEYIEEKAFGLLNREKIYLKTNLLVITSRADEALWWLRQILSLTNLPFVLFDIGISILGWSSVVCVVLGLIAKFLILFVGIDHEIIIWLVFPFILSLTGGLIFTLLGIITISIIKFTHRFFGTGQAISFWSDIVTRTKVNKLPFHKCNDIEESCVPISNIHGGLWHSKYTRSGEVVDQIAKKIGQWVETKHQNDEGQQHATHRQP